MLKVASVQKPGIIKTGALDIADLSASKLFYSYEVHYHTICFLVKSVREAAMEA